MLVKGTKLPGLTTVVNADIASWKWTTIGKELLLYSKPTGDIITCGELTFAYEKFEKGGPI